MHDHSLANPTDVRNEAAHRSPPKPINPRCNLNRPPPAWNALDISYTRSDDAEDSSAHRLYFGQLRHSDLPQRHRDHGENSSWHRTVEINLAQ
jgi:hypothetical protein